MHPTQFWSFRAEAGWERRQASRPKWNGRAWKMCDWSDKNSEDWYVRCAAPRRAVHRISVSKKKESVASRSFITAGHAILAAAQSSVHPRLRACRSSTSYSVQSWPMYLAGRPSSDYPSTSLSSRCWPSVHVMVVKVMGVNHGRTGETHPQNYVGDTNAKDPRSVRNIRRLLLF